MQGVGEWVTVCGFPFQRAPSRKHAMKMTVEPSTSHEAEQLISLLSEAVP